MGFLSWRAWDRLDDLDHRSGIRRQPTEASIQRSQRFMWAITAWVFVAALVSVVQRDWAWAVTLFVISVVSVFMNRRAIRKLREGLGSGPTSKTGVEPGRPAAGTEEGA